MFTLAVEDVVEVPVKFTLRSGKVDKPFAVNLTMRRYGPDDEASESADMPIREFVLANTSGWSAQTLVLDADNKPAAFSPQALEKLLGVGNVLALTWAAYLKECGAKEKN